MFTLILALLAGILTGAALGWLLAGQRFAGAAARLGLVETRLQDAETSLAAERDEKESLLEKQGNLTATNAALEAQLATQTTELKALHTQLETAFTQVAAKVAQDVMEAKVTQMKQLNAESVGNLVNPLREQLEGFKKQVQEAYGQENEKRAELGGRVEELMKATQGIQTKAEALTQALTGNVKMQGNWGESMLAQVLEASGLRAGEEYQLQVHRKGPSGEDYFLDALVNLPDGKRLVVDAKVSLQSYVALCNAPDEPARAAAQRDFVASVKRHIEGLGSKNYATLLEGEAPDFTVLFMPVEGALLAALQAQNDLWSYAWSRRIALAGPGTLFPILRTAASLWQIDKQNKNAQAIADTAGKLSDKLMGMVADMEGIRRALGTADRAVTDLETKFKGKGGVVSTLGKMEQLGAKPTKPIPLIESEL